MNQDEVHVDEHGFEWREVKEGQHMKVCKGGSMPGRIDHNEKCIYYGKGKLYEEQSGVRPCKLSDTNNHRCFQVHGGRDYFQTKKPIPKEPQPRFEFSKKATKGG